MEQRPPRQQDPLALVFFGVALALLAGLLLYVVFFKTPEPATPARAIDVVELLRRKLAGLGERPAEKPAAKPASPSIAAGTAARLEPGHSWLYAVTVEPPLWRDVTLTYRTQNENGAIGVLTDFRYAGGQMNFHLGIFAPGHPTHANTRFPGFFMYASYFRLPLLAGQRLSWEWSWQGAGAGRVKRYEGVVARWEEVRVPAGTYAAAVIEADLYYIQAGKVQAQTRETIWYAPKAFQVVKVVRDGGTPDEGSRRIVAELAEFR